MLELLSRCGGPSGLRKAGRAKLNEIAVARAPRMGARLVEQILTALNEQTVTVPGSQTAETILPRLADSLRSGGFISHRPRYEDCVEQSLC